MSDESQDKPIDLDPDREALRRSYKKLKQKPPPEESSLAPNDSVELRLTTTDFQRGLQWRGGKIDAIFDSWKEGKSDAYILWHLRRGGMTKQTAWAILVDAHELSEGPPSQSPKKGQE